MYAKIPFDSGWSTAQVMSVLHYLIGGNTTTSGLPFGVKETAEIVNTVPHNYVLSSPDSTVIWGNAPMLGTTRRKHFRITSTSTSISMFVGDNATSSACTLLGTNVSQAAILCLTSAIATTTMMALHVTLTPTRFMVCLEALASTNPVTSNNTNFCISGTLDMQFNAPHFGDEGKLMPFALFNRLELGGTSTDYSWCPLALSDVAPRPNPAFGQYRPGQFVFGGGDFNMCAAPYGGLLLTAPDTTTDQQLYEFGWMNGSANSGYPDPVIGVVPDVYLCASSYVAAHQNHTIDSKPYVAWSTGTGNAATKMSMLVPKE